MYRSKTKWRSSFRNLHTTFPQLNTHCEEALGNEFPFTVPWHSKNPMGTSMTSSVQFQRQKFHWFRNRKRIGNSLTLKDFLVCQKKWKLISQSSIKQKTGFQSICRVRSLYGKISTVYFFSAPLRTQKTKPLGLITKMKHGKIFK